MENTTAAAIIAQAKENGHTVTLALNVGTTPQTGDPISVNSKGVNIKVDGKVRSFSLKKVDSITINTPQPEGHDGMSTAEVAEMFNMSAKELRVHLRKLGLGVGKGRRYGIDQADLAKIKDHLVTADA